DTPLSVSRCVTSSAATVWRSPPWSARRGARLIGSPSTARRNWRMRSRHSTRTCYQISLRLRFDATETRACGRERRRCHVKGLIAWPKASNLVGLFPECIVTRTVSIKACVRHRRRGDRATVRGIYKLAYLHAEIASSHRAPRDQDQADVDFQSPGGSRGIFPENLALLPQAL